MKSWVFWSLAASVILISVCGKVSAQGAHLSRLEPSQGLEEIDRHIDESLDSLVELKLEQSTLNQLAVQIRDQFEINVRLDEVALDQMGLTADSAISATLQGIPLRAALRLLLKDLEMTYSIDQGVLVLTTVEAAGENLLTKTYDVSELVRGNSENVDEMILYRKFVATMPNLDGLRDLIRRNVIPDSWDELGGTATMSALGLSEETVVLTISQTQEAHDRIRDLIKELKQIQTLKADAVDKKGVEAADAKESKVQVYALDASMTAEQGVELVKAALDDIQWAAESSFIKPIADTLVIKQSAAVHARIFKLLNDLRALRGPDQVRPDASQPTTPVPASPPPVVG